VCVSTRAATRKADALLGTHLLLLVARKVFQEGKEKKFFTHYVPSTWLQLSTVMLIQRENEGEREREMRKKK